MALGLGTRPSGGLTSVSGSIAHPRHRAPHQARLSDEKISGLMEDRRVRDEEFRAASIRDTDQNQALTDRLHNTQNLLYDSTRDFLELKFEHRSKEKCVARTGWLALPRNASAVSLLPCRPGVAAVMTTSQR